MRSVDVVVVVVVVGFKLVLRVVADGVVEVVESGVGFGVGAAQTRPELSWPGGT